MKNGTILIRSFQEGVTKTTTGSSESIKSFVCCYCRYVMPDGHYEQKKLCLGVYQRSGMFKPREKLLCPTEYQHFHYKCYVCKGEWVELAATVDSDVALKEVMKPLVRNGVTKEDILEAYNDAVVEDVMQS